MRIEYNISRNVLSATLCSRFTSYCDLIITPIDYFLLFFCISRGRLNSLPVLWQMIESWWLWYTRVNQPPGLPFTREGPLYVTRRPDVTPVCH